MIWTTKKRQQVESTKRLSRYGRTFMIGCDMCFKVEFGIVPFRHVLEFYLEQAGWDIKEGAVVCPECLAEMMGA